MNRYRKVVVPHRLAESFQTRMDIKYPGWKSQVYVLGEHTGFRNGKRYGYEELSVPKSFTLSLWFRFRRRCGI